MASPLPVWLEVHVDDEILRRDAGRWSEARDLLERVAALAERRGARLCFRVREWFAAGAAGTGFLPALASRGHEVGVHAHGRRLREVVEATREAGVIPRVAVPGLVQAGRGGRAALLRQAAALGIGVVTDHGAVPSWAYDGLLPRAEHGVLVMGPTVRPFDWGLMDRDGTRHGLTPPAIERLRRLERMAGEHGARWFGLALHEHDLCPAGSLTPADGALETLASFLDARVVPALEIADAEERPPSTAPRHPPSDHRVRLARLAGRLGDAARRRVPLDLLRPRSPRRSRRHRPPRARRLTLPVGRGHVVAERHGAPDAVAACVCSVSGPAGGREVDLRFFGLAVGDLVGRGWAVWLYDRSGTGDSPGRSPLGLLPGNPEHVRDWRAVLEAARGDGIPVIALSWSAGLVPVLRAAAEGFAPDAVVDAEAPADRWSLVHPGGKGPVGLDPWVDADWEGLEAVRLLPSLGRPYARLQAADDHVHRRMTVHAERMVAAARDAGLTTRPLRIVPGRLHRHPDEVLDALEWARAAATSRAF